MFVVGLVCVGVAGMLGLVILLFGSVSGSEFSPTHFEMRRFSVHEIPWLQVQISPITRSTSQSATSRYLIAQSLIQTLPGAPKDWHLVELSRGGISQSQADAKLLTDQLELYLYRQNSSSSSNEFWHDWSIQQPAKAKVLWPTVQKLAIRELYILLPNLFSLAIDAEDEVVLQQEIDEFLRASYFSLVTEMRDADRMELADELLAEALLDYPDAVKLRALQ